MRAFRVAYSSAFIIEGWSIYVGVDSIAAAINAFQDNSPSAEHHKSTRTVFGAGRPSNSRGNLNRIVTEGIDDDPRTSHQFN